MAGKAVETTMRVLAKYGPSLLRETYFDGAVKPKGKHLPRLQAAAGPHKDQVTESARRGLGFGHHPVCEREVRAGDRGTADQGVPRRAPKLRFSSLIYNGKEWNGAGKEFPHVDEAHKTHIICNGEKATPTILTSERISRPR
jgi:hypothetical protein